MAITQGYKWMYAHGWVFNSQFPGTVPLKVLWHSGRKDSSTVATDVGEAEAIAAGYRDAGIEGYVFSTPQGNFTVPLKLYWHNGWQDSFLITPGFSEDQAILAGYRFIRVEGYIPDQTPYALLWRYFSLDRGDILTTKQNTETSIDAADAGYAGPFIDGSVWRFPFPETVQLRQYWSGARSDHCLLATPQGDDDVIAAGYSLISREDFLGEPGGEPTPGTYTRVT